MYFITCNISLPNTSSVSKTASLSASKFSPVIRSTFYLFPLRVPSCKNATPRTWKRNKSCEKAEIRCSVSCSYHQRRPFCWYCQRPGRRCWTGALPSASQAWTERGWPSPCATGAPGGRLLLRTRQDRLTQPAYKNAQNRLEQRFPSFLGCDSQQQKM